MRRTIVFIFAVLYSLISSGAPALLHYCGHKKNVHLSVSHNNLPENSDCCHAASLSCGIDVNAAPELDDQDCCVLSEVDLDSRICVFWLEPKNRTQPMVLFIIMVHPYISNFTKSLYTIKRLIASAFKF